MIEKLEQTELQSLVLWAAVHKSVRLEGLWHKGKIEQAFSRETKPRPKGVKCLPRRHQTIWRASERSKTRGTGCIVSFQKKKNVPCRAICSRFLGKSLHVELCWVSRNKMQRHLQQRTIVDWASVRFGSLSGSRLFCCVCSNRAVLSLLISPVLTSTVSDLISFVLINSDSQIPWSLFPYCQSQGQEEWETLIKHLLSHPLPTMHDHKSEFKDLRGPLFKNVFMESCYFNSLLHHKGEFLP